MQIVIDTKVRILIVCALLVFCKYTFAQDDTSKHQVINAIFSQVTVDPKMIETIKVDLRKLIPGSHVRRMISGGRVDQTVMIMHHPKGNFREAINDYYRVLDQMSGVISTETYLGTTDNTPSKFPDDKLIGWIFLKFEPVSRIQMQSELNGKLIKDSDVLEVAKLSGEKYDLAIVYKFDGGAISALETTKNRLQSIIGSVGILGEGGGSCP